MSNKVLEFIHAVPGMVFEYAGASAPTGFLMCYGQAIVRADYPDLFAAIGTAFGVGNGTTTFNVPDCRGRVSVGKDNMGGAAAGRMTAAGGLLATTLGGTGGAETHTLTEAQMPSHWHGPAAGASNIYGNIVGGTGASTGADAYQGVAAFSSTGAKGGSGAHPNVQPSIVFNKMIKT